MSDYSDLISKVLVLLILLDFIISLVLHVVAGYELGIISFFRKSFLQYDFFISIGDVLMLTLIRVISLTPVFWERQMKQLGSVVNSVIILIINCILTFLIIKIVSIYYTNSFDDLVGNHFLNVVIIYVNIVMVFLGLFSISFIK